MASLSKDTIPGGARGTITLLKNQVQRLFSANISVTNDPDAVQWRSDGFRIVDSASIETWWDPLSAALPTLWQSNLKLTGRSTKVAWGALQLQFGGNASKNEFRENFERNLKDAMSLYSQAQAIADSSNLLLTPSPPSTSKPSAG